MRNDGYKQFFKQARDVRQGNSHVPNRLSASPARKSQAGPANQFKIKKAASGKDVESELRRKLNVRRAPAPFPWKAVLGLVVSVSVAAYIVLNPQAFEKMIEKIEIQAIGNVQASESKAAEKSTAPAKKEEETAATAKSKEPAKGLDEKTEESEELSHYAKLRQRKVELDLREKELAELEEELQRQKVELDKRIQQLEEMRGQIAQILKDRVEVDQQKVDKLVDLYSNMKPKQAADVIGTINEDLAVEVLAKMKKKSAAEVMNLLPAEKARVLSERYTGYRRSLASSSNGSKGQ